MRRVKEVSGSGTDGGDGPRGKSGLRHCIVRNCSFRRTKQQVSRGRLRGTSLVEAIVAAVVFLIVFAATMELLPRLTLRGDEALVVVEAEYRAERAFDKYASGLWPVGTYAERHEWGCVTIRIEPYRSFPDARTVTVTADVDGSRKRIARKQVVEWRE